MKPEEVLQSALERKPGADREAYLDAACEGDAGLRDLVEGLLRHSQQAQGFLETLFVPPPAAPLEETAGSVIGRYKLLQEIGEGGFGVVWMAEQQEPVRRLVALKVIKLGMDTREVVARFEVERQALALMDHPNIARVLDAGATDAGRPYFVMELVRGVPITEYADAGHLSTRERLELFVQVCGAVQHAHQKGIIHRDIKPSNILVTLHDGVPVPKVIDFGIAKATGARLTEKTLFTRFRQFIGTPAYMSPEQAEISGLDVDTRSDVYSLGVLLYELLTGTTPLDPEELRDAALSELQRMIREVDPPAPSTRLSTRRERLPSVAAQRRTEPAKLSALVRGDLDWIALKCLEKDRSRRYETASDLAMDIRRHLIGDPVLAAPPSRVYRLQKLVRRNKGPVVAGGLVAAALVLGLAGATWGMLHASAGRKTAEVALRRVETINAFVVNTLRTSDPHHSGSAGMLVTEAMRKALAGLEAGELREDPETEAQIRATIAGILADNGKPADALPLAQRALRILEDLHPGGSLETAGVLDVVGTTLSILGRRAEAAAVHERALEMTRGRVGPVHEELAARLERLGRAMALAGRREEAERYCREALEMTEKLFPGDHSDRVAAMEGLAVALEYLGRPAAAEDLYRRSLEMARRVHPPDHPTTGVIAGALGRVLRAQGRVPEAEPYLREALQIRRRLFPGDDRGVAVGLCDLGMALDDLGRREEAESSIGEALAMRRRMYAGDHPDLAMNLGILGDHHFQAGEYEKAEPLFQEALAMHRRLVSGDSPAIVLAMNSLALTRLVEGDATGAEADLREAVAMARRLGNGAREEFALVLHHHAAALAQAGETEAALRAAREAAEVYAGHPDWAPREEVHALTILVSLLQATGSAADDLVAAARRLVAAERRLGNPDELARTGSMALLGLALETKGTLEAAREAEPLVRRCLEVRSKAMQGDWRLANTKSLLGGVILRIVETDESLDPAVREERLAEAERLILEGWEELDDAPGVPPPLPGGRADRKGEALERAIRLYSERDRREPGAGWDAKAAEWRGKRSSR